MMISVHVSLANHPKTKSNQQRNIHHHYIWYQLELVVRVLANFQPIQMSWKGMAHVLLALHSFTLDKKMEWWHQREEGRPKTLNEKSNVRRRKWFKNNGAEKKAARKKPIENNKCIRPDPHLLNTDLHQLRILDVSVPEWPTDMSSRGLILREWVSYRPH